MSLGMNLGLGISLFKYGKLKKDSGSVDPPEDILNALLMEDGNLFLMEDDNFFELENFESNDIYKEENGFNF